MKLQNAQIQSNQLSELHFIQNEKNLPFISTCSFSGSHDFEVTEKFFTASLF